MNDAGDDVVMPVKSFYGSNSKLNGSAGASSQVCNKLTDMKMGCQYKTVSQKGVLHQLQDDITDERKLLKPCNSSELKEFVHAVLDRKPKTVEHKTWRRGKFKDSPKAILSIQKQMRLDFQGPENLNAAVNAKLSGKIDKLKHKNVVELGNKSERRFFKNLEAKAKTRVITFGHRRITVGGTSVNMPSEDGCSPADSVKKSVKPKHLIDRKSLASVCKVKNIQPDSGPPDNTYLEPQHEEMKFVDTTAASLRSSITTAPGKVTEDAGSLEASMKQTLSNRASSSPVSSDVLKMRHHQQLMASPVMSQSILKPKRKLSELQLKRGAKKDRKEQMILDAGQKLHGTINCSTCGMTYSRCHPDDELMHSQHHRDLARVLHFPSRTNMRVVCDFDDGSCVAVITDDDRRFHKRVGEIKKLVDKELGYVAESPILPNAKTFLYVTHTQVVGYCLVLPMSQAYKMQDATDASKSHCCSEQPVSVRCGVSRIWVLASHRRKGVASRLLDVVRGHYMMGYPLSVEEIAFSDPTVDGAKFASAYCHTGCFNVYSHNTSSQKMH